MPSRPNSKDTMAKAEGVLEMLRLYTKDTQCYVKPDHIKQGYAYLYGKRFRLHYDDDNFIYYITIKEQAYIVDTW